MTRLIDIGLETLSRLLFKMGDMAEETVFLSLDTYLRGLDESKKIRLWSETLVVLSEEVEDKAIELIARFQPVATDLRTIESYMRIAYDLSRYGRYAWDIIFIHKKLEVNSGECILPSIPMGELAQKVRSIVHTSVEAVKRPDVDLAQKIGELEDEIDVAYYACLDKLVEEDPRTTKCLVTNLLFIRHLERIADHASYIGEAIIYLLTGKRTSLRGRLSDES
jgi:phosphate transport system protein